MQNSNIAVVILNWNGRIYLEKFLPSVLRFSHGAGIYIADNNSTDDSVDFILNNFPEVKIIKNELNLGFAGGYNQALKEIKSEYYVLLNSDVEVTENWLIPLRAFLDQNSEVAACQPKILDYNNRNYFEFAGASGGFIDYLGYPFCRGRVFDSIETDNGQYNEALPIFWASGACLFIRSKVYWEVGGFDEDLFAHMEEIDLCWRIANKGYQVYALPSSFVYHIGGATLQKSNPQKTFLNFRNNLIILTKNYSGKNFFFLILFRLFLDGVAGLKFLFEMQPLHFFSVIRAHWSYFFVLKKTLQKIKSYQDNPILNTVLKRSVVYLYFIRKIKKFSEIERFLH